MQLIASSRYRIPGQQEKKTVSFYYNHVDRSIYRKEGSADPFKEFTVEFIKEHQADFDSGALSHVMKKIIIFCNSI